MRAGRRGRGSVRGWCSVVATRARACSLMRHVGVQIGLGGAGVLVAEPERDDRGVDPGVQQRHRRGMAQGVRGDVLGGDARAGRVRRERRACGSAWRPRRVTTGGPALVVNSRIGRSAVVFGEPNPQCGNGLPGQAGWHAPCGPCRAHRHVRAGCRGRMSPRVRPISSETRSPVWQASSSRAWSRRPSRVARSGAASSASISAAVRKHTTGSVAAFRWDRQHSADLVGVFGCVQRGVAEQGVDRGQAGVAGGGGVAALGFQVGQERGDQLGVDDSARSSALGCGTGCAGGELRAAAGRCRGRRRWCSGRRGVVGSACR